MVTFLHNKQRHSLCIDFPLVLLKRREEKDKKKRKEEKKRTELVEALLKNCSLSKPNSPTAAPLYQMGGEDLPKQTHERKAQ